MGVKKRMNAPYSKLKHGCVSSCRTLRPSQTLLIHPTRFSISAPMRTMASLSATAASSLQTTRGQARHHAAPPRYNASCHFGGHIATSAVGTAAVKGTRVLGGLGVGRMGGRVGSEGGRTLNSRICAVGGTGAPWEDQPAARYVVGVTRG